MIFFYTIMATNWLMGLIVLSFIPFFLRKKLRIELKKIICILILDFFKIFFPGFNSFYPKMEFDLHSYPYVDPVPIKLKFFIAFE